MTSLHSINLNLLIKLKVLLEEANVTAASKRLNITQAAASNALNQLRALFNDELLVRTKNHMLLTERAQSLLPQIRVLMNNIEEFIYQHEDFNPQEQVYEFSIGMNDYAELLLLPKLVSYLNCHAPNVSLKILNRRDIDNQQELESGRLDLMMGYYPNPPSTMMQKKLFNDSLACVVSEHHPLVDTVLTQKNFFSYDHIVIGSSDEHGTSNTLSYLANLGYEFKPKLLMQNVASASIIAADTTCLLITTKKIADYLKTLLPLHVIKYPFTDTQKSVSLYWHKRYNASQPHQWLREVIKEVLS